MSLSLSGGMGVILGVFIGQYVGAGHSVSDITLLITLPSLFIGLGGCSAAFRRTGDGFAYRIQAIFSSYHSLLPMDDDRSSSFRASCY